MFANYPFHPGEDPLAATARYFPQAQVVPAPVEPERQLVVIKPAPIIPNEIEIEVPRKAEPYRIPLSRVDEETLVKRLAAEAARIAAVRNPMKKKRAYQPTQLGEPNRDRFAKGEGFEMENLAPPGAPPVVRANAKAPLTPPEVAKRQTFLDKALHDAEVHALFRFVVGTMIGDGQMRLSAKDDRRPEMLKSDGSNSTNKLPFTNAERLEIGARQFVNSKLPEESQRDMAILTDQIMPRDRGFYLSPTEFGRIVSGSSDERVAKGAYIGTFKKLSHHVNQLYVEWELIQFRQRQEAKAERKARDSQHQELSTGNVSRRLVSSDVT